MFFSFAFFAADFRAFLSLHDILTVTLFLKTKLRLLCLMFIYIKWHLTAVVFRSPNRTKIFFGSGGFTALNYINRHRSYWREITLYDNLLGPTVVANRCRTYP